MANLEPSNITLKDIFMFGMGVVEKYTNRYNWHRYTAKQYSLQTCCAVARIHGFTNKQICDYTQKSQSQVSSGIAEADKNKVDEMNSSLIYILKS